MTVRNTPHSNRRSAAIASAAALALAAGSALPAAAQSGPDDATGVVTNADSPRAIDGSFIVELDQTEATVSTAQEEALTDTYDIEVTSTYEAVLGGYAIKASAAEAERLAADPAVAAVHQDTEVSLATETQDNPPSWGLDRIDQPELPLDDSYTYPAHAGEGTTIYVVDTGILHSHDDFDGRAVEGFDAFGGDGSDANGHGTHVASTAAGSEHGVAKSADLVSVKVLDDNGSGSTQGVIDGVEWVTENADGDSVANMSLGGLPDEALDTAVEDSIASGVTYAVAAGNEGQDAENSSPARVADAITVGSTDINDARSTFSNYGSIDIFAPGEEITAAWSDSDDATDTISGTSMASPHVAGAAALALADAPGSSPADVWETLEGLSVADAVSDPGTGSPNQLLQVPGAS